MKILMIAIPNHHFFQWVNQLKESGYEVIWFDITDGGSRVEKINWITQIKGWKLKKNFPLRHFIKARFPRLYKNIQKINEHDVAMVFEQKLLEIQPDIVQCFEMKLAGLPILSILEKHTAIPLIYNSWGSDLFFYKEMNVSEKKVKHFLKRVNYFISDCERDYKIALKNDFDNEFLGVFPGNGGIQFVSNYIKETKDRNIILIKGYEDGVGKAVTILEALQQLPEALFINKKIVIFSADITVQEYIEDNSFFKKVDCEIISRYDFVPNDQILKIMGNSILYIGNSISDGMPNTLLEAMGMGAFPIQSNPGGATAEVIIHKKNGLLIENPFAVNEITNLISTALEDEETRMLAQEFNINFILNKYDRTILKPFIVNLYASIYAQSKI